MEEHKVVEGAAVIELALVSHLAPCCIGGGEDGLRDVAGLQNACEACTQDGNILMAHCIDCAIIPNPGGLGMCTGLGGLLSIIFLAVESQSLQSG